MGTQKSWRFSEAYVAEIPAHGSKLLKVSGQFDWSHGAVWEAEWPGNIRQGGARLLNCGECSRGYGVGIGSIDGKTSGALTFRHLDVAHAGTYKMELTYVRNGLGDKTIHIQVNNSPSFPVKALMREWNWITIPVDLHAGDNSITVSYSGNGTFNIDKIRLLR